MLITGLVFGHMHAYVHTLYTDAWEMCLPKEVNITRFDIHESFTPFELCKAVINRCGAAGSPPIWHDTRKHAISLSCSARDVLPVRESTCWCLAGTRKMSPSIKMLPITCPSRKCLIWKRFPSLVHVLTVHSGHMKKNEAKIKVALSSVAPADSVHYRLLLYIGAA